VGEMIDGMKFTDAETALLLNQRTSKKRRPPQGGRRANDAIVGVVYIIYTMFHAMSRVNSQVSRTFNAKIC